MPIPTINNSTFLSSVKILTRLQSLRQLGRLELSAMVALSALAGYLFAGGQWQVHTLLVTVGVGLLATGCSALNQWQEQDLDLRMERTMNRPLPTGKLPPSVAVLVASVNISCGALLLSALPGSLPLLLGLLAVIWYNAIYTPLKRVTPFCRHPRGNLRRPAAFDRLVRSRRSPDYPEIADPGRNPFYLADSAHLVITLPLSR